VGINRAIERLRVAFALFFVLLAARAVWVQVIAGPRLAADSRNPRRLLLDAYRGDILARDGTVLAHSMRQGRTYPFGRALAHAVGYDSARYGTFGLERALDAELSARAASIDPASQLLSLLSASPRTAAVRGNDVITTIEPATQNALYEGISAYPRAAGVVLDPRSGEVLALASVPAFDPASIGNDFAGLSADATSPLLDRATDGLYPPGSTFKVFTAAAALDSGTVVPSDRFVDNGGLAVGTFVVHDNEGEATGVQDLAGAFALSSNVDFAQIALRLGVDLWFEYVDRFGLGRSTEFTLPVTRDHLPARASVSPSILAQLAFGQADLAVTPLRMALITATIASGGIEPQPSLVRAVRDPAGRLDRAPRGSLATPISPQTANEVRELMVATVQRGTGTAAALPYAQVAGKTGTATNPAGRSHAWFVAFAPADAPRIALAIVVENAGYGGVVAAPIARRVLATALAHGAP
jgi:peptidoglycan glycosyltransferase